MKAIVALGLGALAMYFFDPQQGRRRRALMRDQITHANRVARERAGGLVRDLSNRAYGTAVEARKAARTHLEPDRPTERPTDTPQGARHLGR